MGRYLVTLIIVFITTNIYVISAILLYRFSNVVQRIINSDDNHITPKGTRTAENYTACRVETLYPKSDAYTIRGSTFIDNSSNVEKF